ncbi:MAG: NifU family protein [Actinobacteria bacterium]|nr:NifU family protein [Actinomycetota bacterium]
MSLQSTSLHPQVAAAMDRLDELVTAFEQHPDPQVVDGLVEVLRAVDMLHRGALQRVAELLDAGGLRDQALADPDVALLFGLYEDAPDEDEQARAEAAVEAVRPYVEAHGGRLEVVASEDGVVSIRLLGECESCSHSPGTLRRYVEDALREALPEFTRMNVAAAPAHTAAPTKPAPVLIPISALSQRPGAPSHGGCGSGGGCGTSARGCSACG